MSSVQSPPDLRSPAAKNLPVQRGLGWDIHTPYRTPPHDYTLHRGAVFPVGGYGHKGWTGQMLWIDPLLAHDCDFPLQPLPRLHSPLRITRELSSTAWACSSDRCQALMF